MKIVVPTKKKRETPRRTNSKLFGLFPVRELLSPLISNEKKKQNKNYEKATLKAFINGASAHIFKVSNNRIGKRRSDRWCTSSVDWWPFPFSITLITLWLYSQPVSLVFFSLISWTLLLLSVRFDSSLILVQKEKMILTNRTLKILHKPCHPSLHAWKQKIKWLHFRKTMVWNNHRQQTKETNQKVNTKRGDDADLFGHFTKKTNKQTNIWRKIYNHRWDELAFFLSSSFSIRRGQWFLRRPSRRSENSVGAFWLGSGWYETRKRSGSGVDMNVERERRRSARRPPLPPLSLSRAAHDNVSIGTGLLSYRRR